MARFDLYGGIGEAPGYVVDVQADLLDSLVTRVVVPLLAGASGAAIRDLNPTMRIGGRDYTMVTQELAAVPRAELGRPVGSLAERRDDITRALDVLLTGF